MEDLNEAANYSTDIKDSAPEEGTLLELLELYIDLCEAVLVANIGNYPFHQILVAQREGIINRFVKVQLLGSGNSAGNSADNSLDYMHEYWIIIEKDQVRLVPSSPDIDEDMLKDGQQAVDHVWSVRVDYLRNAIQHEQDIKKNPAMLDWGWIFNLS